MKKTEVAFVVYGRQKTKANNYKFTCGHKKPYIPKEIQVYEQRISAIAKTAMAEAKLEVMKAPVILQITFYFIDNRRRDMDNFEKTVKDALNKIVYEDDSQIHEKHVYKQIDKDNPRTEITVRILGGE